MCQLYDANVYYFFLDYLIKEKENLFVLTLKYLKETLAIILSLDTNVLIQYLESLELLRLSPNIKY